MVCVELVLVPSYCGSRAEETLPCILQSSCVQKCALIFFPPNGKKAHACLWCFFAPVFWLVVPFGMGSNVLRDVRVFELILHV